MSSTSIAVRTLSALSLIAVITGCGADNTAVGSSQAAPGSTSSASAPAGLINEGTLTVCIDPEYAPLEYYENGTGGDIIGFDADAAQAIADYWGVKLREQVTTFEGLQPGLTSGRCDLIPGGLYMSAERTAVLDGVAYMKTGPALIIPADKDAPSQDSQLCGWTISAQSGSENGTVGEDIGTQCTKAGQSPTTVTYYPKTADTVQAVINGKADALIETDVAAAHIVKQSSGKLKLVDGFFPPSTTFGMFLNKDSELTPALQQAITTLSEDGTLAKIAETYGLAPDSLL